MQIIPAIIPRSFHDLEKHIEEVKDFAEIVQIDIVDGKYAPNKSWPYTVLDDPDFGNLKSGENKLPFWQDIQFEIDLMVEKPENVWKDWIRAGAFRIIVHLESTSKLQEIIEDFRKEKVSQNSFLYSQIGVAIGASTPMEEIYPYLESIDFVQCMGNANIGKHGQFFDEEVLEKIKNIKLRDTGKPIGVDIGMNEKTIPLVKQAGATRVAVGSALFESTNIKETYKRLSDL